MEPFLNAADRDPISMYASSISDALDWLSPLEQQMHVDLKFHLPNDMLVKVDRMSMAHALEVRVPLLDLEVVKVCLAIPSQEKRQRGRGKRPLRRMLTGDVPDDLLQRKKSGFLIPLERWLQHEWQPLLKQYLTAEFAEASGLFRWDVLHQMIDDQQRRRADHAYPLFAMLVLGIWWQMWMTETISVPLSASQSRSPVRIHREHESGDAG